MENKPLKVLQMIPSLDFGGAQMMIVNYYKKFDQNKVHCDFIIDHTEYHGLEKTMKELGSKVFVLPSFNGKNYFEVKKAWNDFFKEHKEYKILHTHARTYASIYIPIAKKYGLKTIIHSHSTSNGEGIKGFIKDILQYPLRKESDYLFACSDESGKWLYGKDVINKDNYYVINNAIDLDRFTFDLDIRNKYRNEFNLKDEKVFIMVGGLYESKNHFFMIEAFKKYLEFNPNDKFFIVGEGVLKEKIIKMINDNNLQNNIIVTGGRDDVYNLLQMADVFLMPSGWEGLSLAAIEAQATGIKCLLNENVDNRVDITNTCIFLPYEIDSWIIEMKKDIEERFDNKQKIIDAGYDITTSSKWLENFYIEISK